MGKRMKFNDADRSEFLKTKVAFGVAIDECKRCEAVLRDNALINDNIISQGVYTFFIQYSYQLILSNIRAIYLLSASNNAYYQATFDKAGQEVFMRDFLADYKITLAHYQELAVCKLNPHCLTKLFPARIFCEAVTLDIGRERLKNFDHLNEQLKIQSSLIKHNCNPIQSTHLNLYLQSLQDHAERVYAIHLEVEAITKSVYEHGYIDCIKYEKDLWQLSFNTSGLFEQIAQKALQSSEYYLSQTDFAMGNAANIEYLGFSEL